VTLTISGGRITTVSANCSPCSGDSYTNSSQRNPLPKLISETLAAQSANIATVGGASETSKGFKSALSAALAKA
jgi:uncharacterized protein with FMN-binding domain